MRTKFNLNFKCSVFNTYNKTTRIQVTGLCTKEEKKNQKNMDQIRVWNVCHRRQWSMYSFFLKKNYNYFIIIECLI